jgi:ATP-binding cassette subfamily C protein
MGFVINEKNNNISGGEKQKISILKVLLKNSPIMIFDEPTSALDYKTTKKFMKYLQESKSDKIIIIISHDDAVIERCDEVVKI